VTHRRITVVTSHVLGSVRTNGSATANTFLALGLAQMGHRVEILHIGEPATDGMDAEWARLYEEAGIAIRLLPKSGETVKPELFARIRAVERALGEDPPDVVISWEGTAPAYGCLRLRQLGLAFENTLFVLFCHGTRQWVKEVTRNERVSLDVLAEGALERACVELADVAVSPSAYMLDWMRTRGWRLPETSLAIPLLTRSVATREQPPPSEVVRGDGGVQRLAFFGRLEERKGVREFIAGLNALEPELLESLEVEFIGRPAKYWQPERVEALLTDTASHALRRVSFETELDQPEALARLSRRGTLALIPSLADNSPCTVYECLEHGIPFLASNVGGIPELVAAEDRSRVLFEPTAEGVEQALRRALADSDPLRPVRPAFDNALSLQRWAQVIARRPQPVPLLQERPPVDVVVVHRQSSEALVRCLSELAAQTYGELRITVAAAKGTDTSGDLPGEPLLVRSERRSVDAVRQAGLDGGTAPWVVFLDEEDIAQPELIETLVRAQAASGADVVSCGLHLGGDEDEAGEYLFAGEPGGFGVLANDYGTVALLRRSLVDGMTTPWPAADPDWPLLARLSAAGSHVVSIPRPLVTRTLRPGTLERHSADALLVVQELEQRLPSRLRSLARLTAGLAAEKHRRDEHHRR
jgi:glycosyltransferase involved in cell wall biosynthesis